jgi:hypothetical protein
VTTWLTSSTTAGSSTRSKEVCVSKEKSGDKASHHGINFDSHFLLAQFRLPVLMTSKAQMEMQQSKLMDRETTLT